MKTEFSDMLTEKCFHTAQLRSILGTSKSINKKAVAETLDLNSIRSEFLSHQQKNVSLNLAMVVIQDYVDGLSIEDRALLSVEEMCDTDLVVNLVKEHWTVVIGEIGNA